MEITANKEINKTLTNYELEKIYQQIVNHRNNYKNSVVSKYLYPYYTSPANLFKHVFYFKYLSNVSFILMVFSYLIGAYKIFEICLAITIANCIIFFIIMIGDFKEIVYELMGNETFNKLPTQVKKFIIDKDSHTIYPSFIIISSLSHLFSVVIGLIIFHYYYHHKSDNYLLIFGLAMLFITGFMLIASRKLYGDIKEELYIALYIPILFTTCYYFFNKK